MCETDLNLKYCVGCCKCYKNGKCIFNDDIEKLSENIETADGIIIGEYYKMFHFLI